MPKSETTGRHAEIARRWKAGQWNREIATAVGLSYPRVARIVSGYEQAKRETALLNEVAAKLDYRYGGPFPVEGHSLMRRALR